MRNILMRLTIASFTFSLGIISVWIAYPVAPRICTSAPTDPGTGLIPDWKPPLKECRSEQILNQIKALTEELAKSKSTDEEVKKELKMKVEQLKAEAVGLKPCPQPPKYVNPVNPPIFGEEIAGDWKTRILEMTR